MSSPLAYSAAGTAYTDAVNDAQTTYVDSYADDWDTMQTSFDTAATDLTESVATADENYVTAADTADETWVTTAETAATSYNTAADTALTTANSSADTAVNNFESTVQSAWATAVNTAYPNAPDAAQYIAASQAYDDSVISAWESANSTAVSLENSYADTVNSASNADLTADADAAHAEDKSEVDAQTQAMIAGTAASVAYDTSYTTAAVADAKQTVADQTKKAEDTATAQQKENDALASAYLTAVTNADTTHQTTVLGADTAIDTAADAFLAGTFAMATQIQVTSEAAANQAATDAIASATATATALSARLVAHTADIGAQRAADAVQAFQTAVNGMDKQFSDLQGGPAANLNSYQQNAASGTIPFMDLTMLVGSLDGLRYGLQQTATNMLKQKSDSTAMMMMTQQPVNTAPGISAGGVMSQLLNISASRTPLFSNGPDGTLIYVGAYDFESDAVYRTVPQADGSNRQGVASMSDVQAKMNSGLTSAQWDGFFGGVTAPPDPNSITHMAINLFIDDAKLQTPGGLASDIVLTAQLVTSVTATLDPTPLSDGINGTIALSQGDYSGAAMTFGGMLVPFGAEKIAKAANRVPTGAVTAAVGSIDNMAASTSKAIANSKGLMNKADEVQQTTKNLIGKCADENCFIAGTQVVMQSSEFPVTDAGLTTRSENVEHASDESGVAAIAAVGLGVGLAVAKSKLESRVEIRRLSRRTDKKRRNEIPDEPSPPPLPLAPPTTVATLVRASARVATTRRWFSKTLTAAMLFSFAVGGWFASQSAFRTNGQANAASLAATTVDTKTSSDALYLTKNIEDVQKGDLVLARDEHGREIGYRRVVEVYRRTSDHLRHLKFRDRNGNFQALQTTDEHPILDAESNTFVNAGDLKELSKVTGPDGQLQTLVFSRRIEHPEGVPVFNFQVEGFHTYYVYEPGASVPVLVHNADYPILPDPRLRPGYDPGATHLDHTLAEVFGGTATRDVPAAMNLRKGGLEGNLRKYEKSLIDNGMEAGKARAVIQSEIDGLARDVIAAPFTSVFGSKGPDLTGF